MSGPEHYREAERLIDQAHDLIERGSAYTKDHNRAIAEARVHATLALAAATALGREGEARTMATRDTAAWFDVTRPQS